MISNMDLRNSRKELRKLSKELKEKQKHYPLFKVMKTRNKGKDVIYKVEYRRKKRIREVLKKDSEEYFNILKGLCIGAKREIYLIMNKLAEQGVAILMASSELPEVMGISDHVIIMSEGTISAKLSRDELVSSDQMLDYAIGGKGK